MTLPRTVGWDFRKARNLFAEILRGPDFDDPSCLALTAGLIALALWQIEPVLWQRGIFTIFETYEGYWPRELRLLDGLAYYPFQGLPRELRSGLWVLVVAVYLVNGALLDRFLANHSGWDLGFRPVVLWIRRLFVGLPLLGLSAFPLWRALCNRKPRWACQDRETKRAFAGFQGNRPETSPPSEGGAGLHSFAFLLWLVVSSLFALRAAVTWLNEPEQATARGLAILQGVCGVLRTLGLVCMLAYVRLRHRQGLLWGKRLWGLLACSMVWLLPRSLFLLAILALTIVGERWPTAAKALRPPINSLPLTGGGRLIATLGRTEQTIEIDQAQHKLQILYREKTFFLMMEVASILMLAIPLKERFPVLALPGCLLALLFLVALATLPLSVAWCTWSRLRWWRTSQDQRRWRAASPLARSVLLVSLAVVAGWLIGTFAARQEMQLLGHFFFWTGVFGSSIALAVAVFKSSVREMLASHLYTLLFLAIGKMGHEMLQGSDRLLKLGIGPRIEEVARFHWLQLYLMIPLVFVLSILVGFLRCRWVVRPYRLKDIFHSSLPILRRSVLALLAVTACLPLGGLMVPVWILLRLKLAKSFLPPPSQPLAGSSPA